MQGNLWQQARDRAKHQGDEERRVVPLRVELERMLTEGRLSWRRGAMLAKLRRLDDQGD